MITPADPTSILSKLNEVIMALNQLMADYQQYKDTEAARIQPHIRDAVGG